MADAVQVGCAWWCDRRHHTGRRKRTCRCAWRRLSPGGEAPALDHRHCCGSPQHASREVSAVVVVVAPRGDDLEMLARVEVEGRGGHSTALVERQAVYAALERAPVLYESQTVRRSRESITDG